MEINVVTKDDMDSLFQKIIEAFSSIIKEQVIGFPKDKLFNNKEACSYLKVCSKTLQNYRDNGLIRFSQKGRKIFYLQEDLNDFLDSNKIQPFINLKK